MLSIETFEFLDADSAAVRTTEVSSSVFSACASGGRRFQLIRLRLCFAITAQRRGLAHPKQRNLRARAFKKCQDRDQGPSESKSDGRESNGSASDSDEIAKR